MGTRYKTYEIDCSRGGLNGNPNVDALPPYAMVYPTRNLNLHLGTRQTRGGSSYVDAAAMTGTPVLLGGCDFTLRSGVQFIVRMADDGKLYKDKTTSIETGLSATAFPCFVTADNTLFLCNGVDVVQTWDGAGAATADITEPAADWAAVAQPHQMLVHGRGASLRLWAINPTTLYASKNFAATGDFKYFVTGAESIYIDTNDGFGLQGMVEKSKELFLFGKTQTYRIDDSNATSTNWGYELAPWFGGVANWRLLVKTPNDVVAMMEDGEIYSVSAVQEYGDYQAASLTRPAFMHKWIQEHISLAKIAQFHAVYDPTIRAVVFFMVKSGYTEANVALLFFIDRPPAEAWMVHDNDGYASGYDAASSFLVRKSVGSMKVYTGNYGGILWELQTASKNDNSNAFYAGFKNPPVYGENPRITKDFNSLRVVMKPQGAYDLAVKYSCDGVAEGSGTISMAGTGGLLDAFVLGTDVLEGADLIDSPSDLGVIGKRLQVELYNNNAGQDFSISKVLIDVKDLGGRP